MIPENVVVRRIIEVQNYASANRLVNQLFRSAFHISMIPEMNELKLIYKLFDGIACSMEEVVSLLGQL